MESRIAFTFRPFDDLNRTDICLIDLPGGEIRYPLRQTQGPRLDAALVAGRRMDRLHLTGSRLE